MSSCWICSVHITVPLWFIECYSLPLTSFIGLVITFTLVFSIIHIFVNQTLVSSLPRRLVPDVSQSVTSWDSLNTKSFYNVSFPAREDSDQLSNLPPRLSFTRSHNHLWHQSVSVLCDLPPPPVLHWSAHWQRVPFRSTLWWWKCRLDTELRSAAVSLLTLNLESHRQITSCWLTHCKWCFCGTAQCSLEAAQAAITRRPLSRLSI